jgi:hypothetical protein
MKRSHSYGGLNRTLLRRDAYKAREIFPAWRAPEPRRCRSGAESDCAVRSALGFCPTCP